MAQKPYIKIEKDGPYLVYGQPRVVQEIIEVDENGISIGYATGQSFEIKEDPVALCRCGRSQNAPFCDGSHEKEPFDGTETASFEPILKRAATFNGPRLTLKDNQAYCAFARFCDAGGRIWNLVLTDSDAATKLAIQEAAYCPAGRLMVFDTNGHAIEPHLSPAISVLEDNGLKISGPLWIKGGITVESADGKTYEVRNRQTLCRCGFSENKPFCNGAHASAQFKAHYPAKK